MISVQNFDWIGLMTMPFLLTLLSSVHSYASVTGEKQGECSYMVELFYTIHFKFKI